MLYPPPEGSAGIASMVTLFVNALAFKYSLNLLFILCCSSYGCYVSQYAACTDRALPCDYRCLLLG